MNKIISLIILIGIAPIFAQEETTAKTTFVIGKVSVKGIDAKATWKPVKVNDLVSDGDTIMTGNGSTITLAYKGSEIKLQQNTTMVMKSLFSKTKEGNFEVKNGMAWYKLVNLGGQKVNSITPTSVAGVRGTSFASLYDEKSKAAMNCVCEGKVEVVSTEPGAKSKMVEKGSGSGFKPGSADIDLQSYKGDISKMTANPSFEKKIKDFPMMKNCLSCHTPKGWAAEGVLKDEKYGK